ncbi:MAG: hypothetical protein P8R42_04285 [Candidatus Binatia bacterium]|nr:hypothetical protein [Candidatus Binatia bacterium]
MMRILGQVVGLALLALAIVQCGGDDICLNCEAVPTPTPGAPQVLTVSGNILSFDTRDPIESILSIGCIDLPSDAPPEEFTSCLPTGEAYPDSAGNFDFRITVDATSSLDLAFWICRRNEGRCGRIEPGDEFAQLSDPDNKLQDILRGWTASISGIDIDFETQTATAGVIRTFRSPTATPTPSTEATPTP